MWFATKTCKILVAQKIGVHFLMCLGEPCVLLSSAATHTSGWILSWGDQWFSFAPCVSHAPTGWAAHTLWATAQEQASGCKQQDTFTALSGPRSVTEAGERRKHMQPLWREKLQVQWRQLLEGRARNLGHERARSAQHTRNWEVKQASMKHEQMNMNKRQMRNPGNEKIITKWKLSWQS